MVLAFSAIPRAPFVATQIGLDPDAHPGTVEIIDGIQRIFFASQKPGMSSQNFLDGLRGAQDFWKFQVGVIKDYAPHILVADTLDPMIGAVLGGIDVAILAKTRPDTFWKTDGARKATFIMVQAATIKTPTGFSDSTIDVQFVIMANAYCDLCAQSSLMDAYPLNYKHKPLAEVDGVGLHEKLALPDNPLTQAIKGAEATVTAKWRNLYVPPKQTAQPRRFTVVN